MFLPIFAVYAQIKEWDPTGTGNGGCMIDGVPTLKCLEVVFGNILYISSAFIVLVLFIMFITGSYMYLTSFGNAEKIKKAVGTIRYAIVGFLLFLSAFLILKTIDILFLGGNDMIFRLNIPGS